MMQDLVDEAERLRRLAELALVEAPVDPLMERICALAGDMLALPMAFVSVVDRTETHIKAHSGFVYASVPRDETFCDTTIRHEAPLIVSDLAADPRFAHNPLVVGPMQLRFYAGVPLSVAPGLRLGSFCVADRRPRELSPAQVDCLQAMAALVLAQIQHHESRQALARQALDLSRKQTILSQTARLARVGGFEIDPISLLVTSSDELQDLLDGVPSMALPLDAFLQRFGGQTRGTMRESLLQLARCGTMFDREVTLAEGATVRHARVHAERLERADGDKIVGIVQDVTDRKAAVGKLEWLATHDGLTKVCNRSAFTERIEQALERADDLGRRVALIMLDVDRFKVINDTLGHDAGDAVLVAVADRLVATVGRRGAVSRLGGDEFGILVADVSAESMLAALASDILATLRVPLVHEGHTLSVRATLGIALSDMDRSCAASLFKDADIALYEAKKAGRDGFALYRSSMREAIETRAAQLATARAATDEGRIEPWYQPKIDLATGTVVGFEALLRCIEPRGILGPDALGPAFADPDVARPIGHLMMTRIAADMRAWRDHGLAFGHIAINAAGAEFYGGDYAEQLLAALARQGLVPECIEVEVSESALLGSHAGKVTAALGRLEAAGTAIALDDFGSGLSSLSNLQRHPVRRLKIDRRVVAKVLTSRESATLVEMAVGLARTLRLDVVAQGIEGEAQLALLRGCGCGFGQGFLFAKPMPASRVPHFMRNWRMPSPATAPHALFG